jgi:aspartyl-tRNA(Asn)/glutamyl-tRNA(Gln) amidotransferase subunit A
MLARRMFLQSAAGALGSAAIPPSALTDLSIAEASRLIRKREVSPSDLTRACLDRIDQLNKKLNAFITVASDQAMATAKQLDREKIPRGPLHGIPIALKDLFDTEGIRTTAASALLADRVPTQDAEVVRRLRAAGAIILGKLNMDEFAYNFTGEASHFGVCKNPWDIRYSPGGSSGGSAVAVAARMCLASLGSDTGGSIRLPASFCGIAGLKPTYGLVPLDGVTPLAWSLDHAGPMCRTVADTATMLSAMTGKVYKHAGDFRKLRVGFLRAKFCDGLAPEVAKAMNGVIHVFEKLGVEVRDATLPDIKPTVIVRAEALAYHQQYLPKQEARYQPKILGQIREGEKVTLADYANSVRNLHEVRNSIARTFEQVDVLLSPTSPEPPFLLGSNPDFRFLRNTLPFNVLGIPTLSIPGGFDENGLPIGVQISGPAHGEERVFALAHAYERTEAWINRRPTI